MAVLLRRNFHINQLFRDKVYRYVLKRTKFCRAIQHAHSGANMKNEYWKKSGLTWPILGFQSFKNSYSSNIRFLTNSAKEKPENLDSLVHYENVSEETLQSIFDRFEELLQNSKYEDWDVNYSNGVLTVTLEENYVYVINKQTPNRQIWLSSPMSGPKRYDYMNGSWIYKHDGVSLHQLLSNELAELLETDADFTTCTYSQ